MSSVVATTLKIALHRWINHRVCHEITGSVASCAVELAISCIHLSQTRHYSKDYSIVLLKIVLQSTVIGYL